MTTPTVGSIWQETADAKDPAFLAGVRTLIRPDKDRLVSIQRQLGGRQDHWAERIAATVEEDFDLLLKDFGCR
ncbi:MAG TPA: hypothetical protein VJW76_06010 [Verrucomicrobiae bacterium]|nr:hypothetical protein [Verrucomicrobiae bacterium]